MGQQAAQSLHPKPIPSGCCEYGYPIYNGSAGLKIEELPCFSQTLIVLDKKQTNNQTNKKTNNKHTPTPNSKKIVGSELDPVFTLLAVTWDNTDLCK